MASIIMFDRRRSMLLRRPHRPIGLAADGAEQMRARGPFDMIAKRSSHWRCW